MTELWPCQVGLADKTYDNSVNFWDIIETFFLWSLMVPFKSSFNNIAQDMPLCPSETVKQDKSTSNWPPPLCGIGLKNQNDAQMFPQSFKTHHMKTKIRRKDNVYHARTERLKKSLIIYTQNLLNQYERLKYY